MSPNQLYPNSGSSILPNSRYRRNTSDIPSIGFLLKSTIFDKNCQSELQQVLFEIKAPLIFEYLLMADLVPNLNPSFIITPWQVSLQIKLLTHSPNDDYPWFGWKTIPAQVLHKVLFILTPWNNKQCRRDTNLLASFSFFDSWFSLSLFSWRVRSTK